MKLYKKIVLTLSVVVASSCTLDLREDPNAVQPDEVLPSLLLNSMQRNLATLVNTATGNGQQLVRQQNAGSALYQTAITPQGLNGFWSTAYSSILQDADKLTKITKPNGYARHTGIARIIQAYTLVTLVDFFGDVPFSEAFGGDANFNPGVDSQADLYDYALVLLDSAKLDLTTNTTTSSPPGYQNPTAPGLADMYYGSGAATLVTNPSVKWIKLANSLKLKILLNLRLTDQTRAETGIAALIADGSATGGFIQAQDENFIFRYGTTTTDPDARHPNFVGQYPAGGGAYMSNWLIWHMLYGYDAIHRFSDQGDPRIKFYFYRQVLANSTSTNDIRCLGESLPTHYPTSTGSAIIDNTIAGRPPMGTAPSHPTNDPTDGAWNRTFCYPSGIGYWGRDHVDPQGIPPDGLLRTAWGVYPTGGRFDSNAGAAVSATVGQRGAGFQPIMMRSYVSFMLAEAALFMSVGGSTALTYYTNGLNQSFTDVRDWAVNGTYNTTTVAATAGEATLLSTFYSLNYLGGALITPVVAATTGNLTSLSGTLTIDGVATVAGDRVLVKNQIAAAGNGIYVVAAGAWTRATDADASGELVNSTFFSTNGVTQAGRRWFQTTTGTITIGTTAVNYVESHSYTVDVTNYVASATAAFSNRLLVSNVEAMNYVAREYWIASYGNGVESYNLYRRTGQPTGMQPVINPTPGPFPRSFWYPANFADLNSTVDQKATMATKVFWDTNGTNLDF